MIEEVGLKQKEYDMIKPKLDDLKYLSETLKQSFITESYEKIIELINEYIEEKFSNSRTDLNNCFEYNYLSSQIVERAAMNYTTILKCTQALEDHHQKQ